MILLDVVPSTLGIAIKREVDGNKSDNHMQVYIPRNTNFPVKLTKTNKTAADNQTEAGFSVYEGENQFVFNNHFLGKFTLEGIPKGPVGQEKFQVTFEIDENGILNVSAKNHSTGIQDAITIKHQDGRLTTQDIENLRKLALEHRDRKKEFQKKEESRNTLENLCNEMQDTLNDDEFAVKITDSDKAIIKIKAEDGFEFL